MMTTARHAYCEDDVLYTIKGMLMNPETFKPVQPDPVLRFSKYTK